MQTRQRTLGLNCISGHKNTESQQSKSAILFTTFGIFANISKVNLTALVNECLYPSPMLQNKLWDVLVGQHFPPVAIFGDILRIKEQKRDAIHFHWQINEHSDIETYSFTRS